MQFTYKTITDISKAEFKDRGSKFLGYAYPVQTAEDIKVCLQQLKKEHPKAVHHCYAYRLGTEGLQFRANDDGEPSGSAGRPILGQIDSAGLTNILIVIVRYFGGTLLGVPGLINAYKSTAAECINNAGIAERDIEHIVQLEFDYSVINDVMQVLKQYNATVHQQEMQLFCRMKSGIPLLYKDNCLARLAEIRGLEVKTG